MRSFRCIHLLLAAAPGLAQSSMAPVAVDVQVDYERAFYEEAPGPPTFDTSPVRRAKLEVKVIRGSSPSLPEDTQIVYTDEFGEIETLEFGNVPAVTKVEVTCSAIDVDREYSVANPGNVLYSISAEQVPSSGAVDIQMSADFPDKEQVAFSIFDSMHRAKDWVTDNIGVNDLNETLAILWAPSSIATSDDLLLGNHFDCEALVHQIYGKFLFYKYFKIKPVDFAGPGTGFDAFLNPHRALADGFALFFVAAVQDDPLVILTMGGRSGRQVIDVEAGTMSLSSHPTLAAQPWYYAFGSDSRDAIAMILWDLIDENEDDNDMAWLDIADVWNAFKSQVEKYATLEDIYTAIGSTPEVDLVMHSRLAEFMKYPNEVRKKSTLYELIPDGDANGIDVLLSGLPELTVHKPSYPTGRRHATAAVAPFLDWTHGAPSTVDIKLVQDGKSAILLADGAGKRAAVFSHTMLGTASKIWFGHTYPVVRLLNSNDLLDFPWIDPKESMDAFTGQILSEAWTFEVIDRTSDGFFGHVSGSGLLMTPADYGDVLGFEGMASVDNTLYEWLGNGATHEAGPKDPKDQDDKMNIKDNPSPGGDDQDDGVEYHFSAEDHTLEITAIVKTSGAKSARYLKKDGEEISLKVTAWLQVSADPPAYIEEELEPVFDTPISGNKMCPVNWGVGVNEATYVGTMITPVGYVVGHAIPLRVRLSYDVETPMMNGPESFGEVEDYEVEIDDDMF